MKCPECNKKGEIIKMTLADGLMFYCWDCEKIYYNDYFLEGNKKEE